MIFKIRLTTVENFTGEFPSIEAAEAWAAGMAAKINEGSRRNQKTTATVVHGPHGCPCGCHAGRACESCGCYE